MRMPDFEPITEVVALPDLPSGGKFSHSQTYHPIVKLADGRLVVDVWVNHEGNIMGKAWRRAAHPNAERIPADAPKVVHDLYSANGQLALLRSSCWFSSPANAAFRGWQTYLRREAVV